MTPAPPDLLDVGGDGAIAGRPGGPEPPPDGHTPLGRLFLRGRLRGTIAVLGPAFVASVAYVDPGNFATNIAAGSRYGYLLVWVLVLANVMGMLVQTLSAKLGIATGKSLPELCREHFGRGVVWGLWVQAELIAMATDLAEFVGAAIALNLLFGVPLFDAGVITAIVAFALLGLQGRGHRRFELAIVGFLAVIMLGFLYNTLRIGFSPGEAARGLVPGFDGTESILLATGILGATVMPHAIYLHSSLTADRIPPDDDGERRRIMRFERLDVVVAMALAGVVNLAMLIVAASLFHGSALSDITTIQQAYDGFDSLVGAGSALAFALALLASGLASSSVATYAGQVVMQGFIARAIPLILRRGITMLPALIVLAVGLNPSRALVLSQVVLSFGIPFALVPLVLLTRREDVMGRLVNHRVTTTVAWAVAAAVIGLNAFLIYDTVAG